MHVYEDVWHNIIYVNIQLCKETTQSLKVVIQVLYLAAGHVIDVW